MGENQENSKKPWLKALRPFSYPASILPLLCATAAAVSFRNIKWDVLLCEIAGVLLLHSIGNLVNDYYDFKLGVDTETEDGNKRPGRYLVKGIMIPKDILLETVVCVLLLLPIGGYLMWRAGWELLIFGALGIGGGYAYTGPPFTFKYRGLGEGTIFTVFGPLLMMGAAFAQTGKLELTVFLISIPVGLGVTSILVSGSLRDIDEERKAGIITISWFLGKKGTLYAYLAILALPELIIAGYVIAGLVPAWGLLTLIAWVPAARLARMAVKDEIPQDIDALTAQQVLTPLCVLLTAAYLI
jgi:1,4-dihydroxy-2-naphthoate octaprenyltransferase